MNILLMVPWDQERGGVATVVNKLAAYLTERGHAVYLLFPGETERPLATTSRAGFRAFKMNLRVPFVPTRPLRSMTAFWLMFPLTLYRLLKLLRQHEIDVVNIHYPTAAAIYFTLCRVLRPIRVVVSAHGADIIPTGRPPTRQRWALRWLLRRCDHVTAPSKNYLESIWAYFPYIGTKSTYIHNGIEIEEFRVQTAISSATPGNLLCIAAHNPKKGIDVLLRAMALVRSSGVDLSLVLAGDGPLRPELETLARELGISDIVEFAGFQDLPALKQQLHRASLFVLPSREEPFGIVILEAMVFGKPVLTTTVGGIPEIVTHLENGYLVPPDDAEALADAIITLSGDASLRQRLGAAGHASILERFTHRHTGAKFELLFSELVGQRSGDQDEDTGSDLPRPFFQTEPTAHRGRLLLLSYHFPPGQATGALRWQKLSRYAAERGWGLDVITLDPSELTAADSGRLAELPRGIRLFGVRQSVLGVERLERLAWLAYRRIRPGTEQPAPSSTEPRDFRPIPESRRREEIRWTPRNARDIMRAYHAWLDYARHGRWARDAARLALRIARAESPLAIISCGPPHMAHDAGRQASQALGLPHIMDLRDPWSLVERLPESIASPVWCHLARHYERRAIARSALIVTNTEPLHHAMRTAYPNGAARVVTVMNGYDDEPIPDPVPSSRFLLAYAGAIYLDRDPRTLFRAAARLIREQALGTADFGIELMGQVHSFDGIPLESVIAEEGLVGFVRLHPPAPRRAAMEFLARATMLVSLPQDSELAIPSKVFDYMRFNAWLLALAEPGSATELLLRRTSADVVSATDLEGIASVLWQRYRQHREGRRAPRIADEHPEYSRRVLAGQLFDALERCIVSFSG